MAKINELVKETKYLKFVLIENKPKTQVFRIYSKKDEWDDKLAEIEWYPEWRQYCFMPIMGTVWNDGCLKDVIEFLEFLRQEHKSKRARKLK